MDHAVPAKDASVSGTDVWRLAAARRGARLGQRVPDRAKSDQDGEPTGSPARRRE
jgi:hypothetical protein